MSKVEELYRLQQLDKKIDQIKEEQGNQQLLAKQDEVKDRIVTLQQQIEIKEEKIESLNKDIKNKEFNTDRLEKELAEYQEQLYNGESNPKELEQLQTKIAEVKKQIAQLEDETLELMMELEEITEKKKEFESKLVQLQDKVANLKRKAENKEQELEQQLTGFKQEIASIKEQLDDELLAKYKQLKESKSGLAVAELEDGYCMGCRVSLPAKLIEDAKYSNQLTKCERCGRILYSSN
ncbi:MAG: zinc ribbon domain-containing protein [Bacillota bacterium]